MTRRARPLAAALVVLAALCLAGAAQAAPAWTIVPGSLHLAGGTKLTVGTPAAALRAHGARPSPDFPQLWAGPGWRLGIWVVRGRARTYEVWGPQWRQSGIRVGDALAKIRRTHGAALRPQRADPTNYWAGRAVDRVTWYLRSGPKAVGFVTNKGRLVSFIVGRVADVRRGLATYGPL